MSLRVPSFSEYKRPVAPGSLFGAAIGTPEGGLWQPLAVSPPRTPPTDAQAY